MSLVYSPRTGRYVSPLTIYTFNVTDAVTGIPVNRAECALSDAPLAMRPYEGVGGHTDINGVCTLEVLYFPPNYYSVYKAGYVTARGSTPGTQINVALQPTEVLYYVTVGTGVGGSVDPSGIFQVAANTKLTITAYPDTGYVLDYWLINGAKSGSTNPLGVVIDKDSFSVYAIFKESEVPPPPPDTPTWPITRQVHLFDNMKIETGWGTWVEKTRPLVGVDTGVLMGAKINYTINFKSSVLPGIHVYFYVNDVEVGVVFPPLGEPVTGEIDITGYLTGTNTFKVGVSAGPAGFNVVYVDEWVTVGYSDEPVIEPSSPFNPYWDWIVKNWKLLAVGGGGLFALYLFTRKGPPVIVVPEYRPRRREEY